MAAAHLLTRVYTTTVTSLIFPRTNAKDMGKRASALLDVWIYFNLITNTFLLPILVATFLISKRVRRHPTLVNLCITWIFSGIFSLLLFFAGQHHPNSPFPNKTLCIIQTSLMYGITPMWSVAIAMLLYYMFVASNDNLSSLTQGKTILMLSAPYVAQCSFTIATLFLAWAHPNEVTRFRRVFYCSLKFSPLAYAMEIFTVLVCLAIMCLEIALALTLYRNWRILRKAGHRSGVDLQLFVRVLVFGVYIGFGMVVSVIPTFDEHSLAPDMYAATIGTVVFLVFGTQSDVLRTWCFWRRSPPAPPISGCFCCPWRNSHQAASSPFDEEKGYGQGGVIKRPASALLYK